MSEILKVENLSKVYKSGERELKVLDNIHFSLQEGESLSIVGPSGSGKTTLLGLCAGLDRPTEGSVHIYNNLLNNMSEDERAAIRNKYVGFIFQNFQLIPTLTAVENVMIPMELKGMKGAYKVAIDLMERVGLGSRADHYPSQLSGGEQQRISLARAFSNEPKILFADEPTGNLDDVTGQNIEELMFDLNKEKGTTLVIVTHDLSLAEKTGRILKLKGGKVIQDLHSERVEN